MAGTDNKKEDLKKNRRSFFTFLLSLLLTLSVVSCSGHNPESRENEPDETNPDTRVPGVAFMEANMVSDPKARTFSLNTLSY